MLALGRQELPRPCSRSWTRRLSARSWPAPAKPATYDVRPPPLLAANVYSAHRSGAYERRESAMWFAEQSAASCFPHRLTVSFRTGRQALRLRREPPASAPRSYVRCVARVGLSALRQRGGKELSVQPPAPTWRGRSWPRTRSRRRDSASAIYREAHHTTPCGLAVVGVSALDGAIARRLARAIPVSGVPAR
jgi:hypothetical protein